MTRNPSIIPDEQGCTELNPLREDAYRWACALGRLSAGLPVNVVWNEPAKFSPLQQAERNVIQAELKRSGGNQVHAARSLGISRSTLWLKVKQYGLSLMAMLPLISFGQIKGATKLLSLAAQPAAPAALTVNPVAPVSAAPAPQRLSNLVPVTLSWQPAKDASVIGYRAFWSTNSAATTNTTIVLRVPAGVTNTFYVVAVDAAGVESVPSNIVPFRAANLPLATLTTAVWSYSTAGYFGSTNRIQTSTNLTDWTTRLTFIGRGVVTNLWRTNNTQEFFRTVTP
jgi:hypothetical protein